MCLIRIGLHVSQACISLLCIQFVILPAVINTHLCYFVFILIISKVYSFSCIVWKLNRFKNWVLKFSRHLNYLFWKCIASSYRDGSVVKANFCSCKGPRFHFQNKYGVLQLSVSLSPRDMKTSSEFCKPWLPYSSQEYVQANNHTY